MPRLNASILQYALAARFWLLFRLQQILQLHHELLYVLEIQVNRGETHIRYLVVPTQPVHDQLAQFAGLALALGGLDYKSFRLIYDLLQLADRYGSLLAGPQQAIQHLLAIEFLPAAVFLDHHVGNFVDALVSGEALAALQTLAAPADGIGFLALARIHHLVIFKTTERTLHDAGNWCNCNRGVFNRRLGAVCRSVTTTHEVSIEFPIRNRSIRWKRRKAVCWSPLRAGSLPTAYGTTIFRDAPAPIPAVPPQQTSPARAYLSSLQPALWERRRGAV